MGSTTPYSRTTERREEVYAAPARDICGSLVSLFMSYEKWEAQAYNERLFGLLRSHCSDTASVDVEFDMLTLKL